MARKRPTASDVQQVLSDFDAGNADWYAWSSGQMLRFGSEKSAKRLMDELLGRPLSPAALLAEIQRIQ